MSDRLMTYKGFSASIMEAERLRGDQTFGLPPGSALPVYHSDAFLKYPEKWMKGPGVFVVPVRPNKGLWFDWRMNSEINTAIIPTVKGCNPITGLQTSGFHLERYDDKCPKHGCAFQADRFCPKCGYKWPDRNYVSMSPSWWDGFRAEDGAVRQFFFTEEMMRDVATHMIGKENTVPAFGFAFYTPKVRRPEPEKNMIRGQSLLGHSLTYHTFLPELHADNCWGTYNGGNTTWNCTLTNNSTNMSLTSGVSGSPVLGDAATHIYASNSSVGMGVPNPDAKLNVKLGTKSARSIKKFSSPVVMDSLLARTQDFEPTKEVSVGAGAKISQELPADSYALDTWKDAPDAVMTVYFVFQETFNEMKAGGMRSFDGVKDGMLAGVPVG